MNKLNVVVWLLLGMLIQLAAYADGAGIYVYQPIEPFYHPDAGYRWRPPSEDQHQSSNNMSGLGDTVSPTVGGRPSMRHNPNNYRPLQEQANPPRVGAYRFRSLSEQEQNSSDKVDRYEPRRMPSYRTPAQVKFREMDNNQPLSISESSRKFRFRPDPRFKTPDAGKAPGYISRPSQAYPPIYATPVFRQEVQDRSQPRRQ